MKIVLVIPKFVYGGAEVMAKHLAIALKEANNDVTVVSLYKDRNAMSDELLNKDVNVIFLNKRKGLDLFIVVQLIKLFKTINPDVVHTHLSALFYAFFAAKIAGISKVVHTFHYLAEKGAMFSFVLYKILFTFCNIRLIAINLAVKDSLVNTYNINPKRVFTINNGEDLKEIIVKKSYSFKSMVNIVHVGRFDVVKNHVLLIDAFKEINDIKSNVNLILYGEGELDEQIRSLVYKYNLGSKVIFAGVNKNLSTILYKNDIFILPSKEEGMPMTIIEAMAAGLPIIASNVGGISEMIKDHINGILIKPVKADIVNAIMLLINDEQLRCEIGKQAVKDSKQFSSNIMANRYMGVYK